jgi:hypothetical protein
MKLGFSGGYGRLPSCGELNMKHFANIGLKMVGVIGVGD